MKKYLYKAKDKNNRVVSGTVEATGVEMAAKLIRERGMVVISLKPAGNGLFSFISRFRSRVSNTDLTTFTRQLATMVNAGLPLADSLAILRLQSSKSIQPIATRVLADVEGGSSLSNALKVHPKVFNPTYIALIKAGETGGVLDKVLVRLADNLERQQEFRGKVKGAMIYPAIIILGMVVVTGIMVIFVIPRLNELYTQFDQDLPFTTQILSGMASLFLTFWPVVLVVFGSLFWGFTIYRKTDTGRRRIDEFIFNIPVWGDLQKEVILADLTRTLSLMVGAGVPILESLSVVGDVVGNVVIGEALADVHKQIEKGFPVAFAFAKHPEAFPYLVSQMVSVGEETGKMDEVLGKVAHVYEVSSEQKIKALTTLIEPAVMVVLGIGVAFLVISVILPIYNLTTSL
ncbi:MAG: hypothetical protein UV74_C0013G0158 [Candidatus Woesebacteria bacterium GW2011_GWB1_43_14]|uniref:Type II secretion system protein GspF domain-containing protein n=1 Tax=Candidatus Woesebacteria bacterium GW2011_GWB1_43_14 TaxID=1618578 RepID=A0A0G1FPS9_9BACT|nr:MAG: type II secretion system F domain protein, type IV pilus assembly protein PilC [Candidatus Woesebacteria bacterium GW2011_GWC1_42_9]KKS97036.1 MAG: hypothetical protein UV74_C0013G0158 [Candidatus Woesebacteria bacterium GW2011_GWB1_43_14]